MLLKKISKITITIITIFFFLPLSSVHAANINNTFINLGKKYGLPLNKEVFCFYNYYGRVAGYNDSNNVRVIPASVSKLYTFDFALNKLGKDFRYTTNVFLNGNTLYINGGGDPHFVIENLRSIIEKVSTDKHILISHFVFSPNFYFNWKTSPSDVTYSMIISLKEDSGAPINPNFSVHYSPTPYYGGGIKYKFQSAPLHMLMKQTSNWSNNFTADTLFDKAGGSRAFSAYMKKMYGASNQIVRFGTGSGLSSNYTTCGLTIRVMKHLEQTVNSLGIGIFNVMSVPRVDPGVLKDAFPIISNTSDIVAKSGTLDYHHNYAGIAYTTAGPIYFAVFSGYTKMKDKSKSKIFAETFIGSLINRYTQYTFKYIPHNYVTENTKIIPRN